MKDPKLFRKKLITLQLPIMPRALGAQLADLVDFNIGTPSARTSGS